MRTSASAATARGSAAKALAGHEMSAVAPRLGCLRASTFGLHRHELDTTRTGADDDTVDRGDRGRGLGVSGVEHLQSLAAERRPRATDAHESQDGRRRRRPVDLELGRVELGGVRRLADLWLWLTEL